MAFFFNREKPGLKEEMRMRFCAPSFSLYRGEVLSPWTLDEMKKAASAIRGKVVILHPGLNTMLSPRQWMNQFSHSYYLIICGDGNDSAVIKLRREAEKIVYGLVAKSLTGVCVVSSEEEGQTILSSIVDETGRDAVTINSTEGELKCFQ